MNQDSSLRGAAAPGRAPKTARGERTRDRLLDAAAIEFGARGFHDASISDITRRAGAALGTFYVYFESKEEIFRALVDYMGRMTRRHLSERTAGAPDRLSAEREGLRAFIAFARAHKDLYRIVMESQFVAPDAYRRYYDVFAEGYRANLAAAAGKGEVAAGDADVRAWALIGMNVFLGLRYGVWDDGADVDRIADEALALIRRGLTP